MAKGLSSKRRHIHQFRRGCCPNVFFPGYESIQVIWFWQQPVSFGPWKRNHKTKGAVRGPIVWVQGVQCLTLHCRRWPHQQNVVWRQREVAKAAPTTGHGTLFLGSLISLFFFATMAEPRQVQLPVLRQASCCCWLWDLAPYVVEDIPLWPPWPH